ncbi:MAG: alpha/beta hydrolase [Verrucomicrobiaceae bacterium]|nr:alpha/beta hydrolase [Verrucomicrobiaceae bacterium]
MNHHLGFTFFMLCAVASAQPRLPRDNLLLLPDGSMAASVKDWEARRNEALEAFQKVAGPLPTKKVPLDIRVDEVADMGSYERRLISYGTDVGNRVPAYLCVPKMATKETPVPAVLCLHPTEAKIGHKVVVGLGGKPHRQYAAELAERGYVTLAPAYTQLANYQPDLKALGYKSGTMKSIWDNICGLDYLDSLSYVKRDGGYGAIGHSLGGHNAIYTAVFDPRIKVVVSSCGFDSYIDYYGGKITGWTQDRYMPSLKAYLDSPQDIPFDFYELVGCLAPRTFYVNAPLRDANFRHDSVDRIMAAAKKVYALHGAEDRLLVAHPDSEHDFPDNERFAAYEVIARVIGK